MLQLTAAIAVFSAAICGFPAFVLLQDGPRDAKVRANLRDVLCRDAWSSATQFGPKDHPITVESRILVFYDDLTVLQQIVDDTGIHDSRGTWSLESGPDGIVIVFKGEHFLVLRGQCAVFYDEKADVMEFRYRDKDRGWYPVYRFERLKRWRPPATSAPK